MWLLSFLMQFQWRVKINLPKFLCCQWSFFRLIWFPHFFTWFHWCVKQTGLKIFIDIEVFFFTVVIFLLYFIDNEASFDLFRFFTFLRDFSGAWKLTWLNLSIEMKLLLIVVTFFSMFLGDVSNKLRQTWLNFLYWKWSFFLLLGFSRFFFVVLIVH